MIDLHAHILPGIDDGAASRRVAIDMLDAAKAMGFTSIAATPHLVDPLDWDYHAAVQTAFALIEAEASERGIALLHGYEIRLSPGLPGRLDDKAVTLGGSRAVLVDLPFIDWPHFVDSTLFAIQTHGFRPVLAHPERYRRIQDDPAAGLELARRGIVLQVTIGSLAGVFGRAARRTAEALLADGAIHLAATDAHSAGHRLAAVPAGLRRLESLVGTDGVRRLTVDAPAALLDDQALPEAVRIAPRSWWDRLPIPRARRGEQDD